MRRIRSWHALSMSDDCKADSLFCPIHLMDGPIEKFEFCSEYQIAKSGAYHHP